jgi:chromosome segregation ATPase
MNEIELAQKKLGELTTASNIEELKLEEMEFQIEEKQILLDKIISDIEESQEKKYVREVEFSDLQTKINNAQEQLDALILQLNQIEEDRKVLLMETDNKISEKEKEFAQIISEREDKVEEEKIQEKELELKITELYNIKELLKKSNQELRGLIDNLEMDWTEKNKTIGLLTDEISSMEKTITEYKSEIVEKQKIIVDLDIQEKELRKSISGIITTEIETAKKERDVAIEQAQIEKDNLDKLIATRFAISDKKDYLDEREIFIRQKYNKAGIEYQEYAPGN